MKINVSNNLRANDDCTNKNYSEAAAIQQLLDAIDEAYEPEAEDWPQLKITIGCNEIAFTLGGPQIEGICKFCQQLADENAYSIDFENNVVDCDDSWLKGTDYVSVTEQHMHAKIDRSSNATVYLLQLLR